MVPALRRRVLVPALLALGCWAACQPTPPPSAGKPPWRLPRKPGESLTHTKLCRCKSCDPPDCCRELEKDRPEMKDCADGYDFSKCELEVRSCDANCYEHSWRIRTERSCEETRPDRCCPA